MKTLSFLINGLYPEVCPCCQKKFTLLLSSICCLCRERARNTLHLKNRLPDDLSSLNLADKRKFYFNRIFYLSYYRNLEKSIFSHVKFFMKKDLFNLIFNIIKEDIDKIKDEKYDFIVPAPSSRPLCRKFSLKLSKETGIPLLNIFYKNEKKESKKMKRSMRYFETEINLKAKEEPLKPGRKKVLIFDDLWTTGATINFMAKSLALKGFSTERIHAMVLFLREKKSQDFEGRR